MCYFVFLVWSMTDGAKQTLMVLFCFRGTRSSEDQCKFADQLDDLLWWIANSTVQWTNGCILYDGIWSCKTSSIAMARCDPLSEPCLHCSWQESSSHSSWKLMTRTLGVSFFLFFVFWKFIFLFSPLSQILADAVVSL